MIDLKDLLSKLNINEALDKIPILRLIPDIEAGYNIMTPEQKAELWKNLLIAAAKAAA
jgi:hypothetical protein